MPKDKMPTDQKILLGAAIYGGAKSYGLFMPGIKNFVGFILGFCVLSAIAVMTVHWFGEMVYDTIFFVSPEQRIIWRIEKDEVQRKIYKRERLHTKKAFGGAGSKEKYDWARANIDEIMAEYGPGNTYKPVTQFELIFAPECYRRISSGQNPVNTYYCAELVDEMRTYGLVREGSHYEISWDYAYFGDVR